MDKMQSFINDLNCRIGKKYFNKMCKPGVICKPIEGSITTECEWCEKY